MLIGVAFGLMGAFLMAGFYVAGALGALSLVLMHFFSDAPLWNIMGNRAWETHTSFILVSIPLFILMGELVLRSGFAERMYAALSRWVVFLPGGLIHTNIASCAVFAACSSSSVSTAATISRISLPTMKARGYNERLVVGSLAAGGTLGILIPPSIIMALYALTVGESMGRLFLAGFIPGFLLALVFMLMIAIVAIVWPGVAPREDGAGLFDMQSWRARIAAIVPMLPIFALIFAVLGSIYMGWATPTEAAALGVTGALILAVIYNLAPVVLAALLRSLNSSSATLLLPRTLKARLRAMYPAGPVASGQVKKAVQVNLKMLQAALLSTVRTSAMLFLILMASFTLQFAFAYLRISTDMASWVAGFHLSPVQLVIVLVFFYLVLGTFLESFAMMMTTLPILLPTLIDTGVNLLWFGIIMVILVEAALVSPPEGINLYVLQGARQDIAREAAQAEGGQVTTGTIGDVWIGVLPFMLCMAIVIALVIAFPEIALWLPNTVKGATR